MPVPPVAEVGPGELLAVVVAPGGWAGLATTAGSAVVPTGELAALTAARPRWLWWSARTTLPAVGALGGVGACWDLGAVGRLLDGLRRDDPAGVWAADHGLPPPSTPAEPDLFSVPTSGPLGDDGQLDPAWADLEADDRGWAADPAATRRFAELALDLGLRQRARLAALPDPRPAGGGRTPLALATAHAESSAALLAAELERDGLPFDRDVATRLLTAAIGPRPHSGADERAARAARTAAVLRHFPGAGDVDLRSPGQVRELLARSGIDLPDTRSWRLLPFADTSAAVAALLRWRKDERLLTTYGWAWLDTAVGADGRLRGRWAASDGAAGRMTAGSGLHNMPALLRPAVVAEPGQVLVRADLGQIEPRVLAAVSGDAALGDAARQADLYAPVAAMLGCDRPTAKIAVLAAMYGQTSGAAGRALRDMERVYPTALAFLRAAEQTGREGSDLRTYGGRLVRLGGGAPDPTESAEARAARGRYARNAAVQGPAAELFKAWAATVRPGVRELGGAIVLCLHDELVLQVPESAAAAAGALLTGALTQVGQWWSSGRVRYVASVGVGADWPAAGG